MKSGTSEQANPQILTDSIFWECIQLAQNSKGAHQRYGSVIVKDGKIVGRGYNRAIAHPSFGKLVRPIYQGYSNHAEVEAICDALMNGANIADSSLYVAGYFPKLGDLLILKRRFDFICDRCPPIIRRYPILTVNLPTSMGWISQRNDQNFWEAERVNKKRAGSRLEQRVASVQGRFTLADLQEANS